MMSPFSLVDGVVLDTSDPQQNGRVKIWCPSVDGDGYNIENIPWARYVSVLAGQTRDYPAGSSGSQTPGLMSYGLWAIPKVGATVVVGFLFNDPNQRFYLGSYFRDHGNRSLPVGRNRSDLGIDTPLSDTFDPVQPQTSNLHTQFNGKTSAPEARTRGAYERQVAQDKTEKDGSEGYQTGLKSESKDLDPQTYCLTTPGRHSLIFQDNPSNSRIRIKTADGHQVIFDDANERIYISTAKGNTWVELDSDGRIHIHAGGSISVASGGDVNLTAAGSINMQAGKDVNVLAGGHARVSACSDISLSGDGGVSITSGSKLDIFAVGKLLQTGGEVHLNGPEASKAPCATAPSVVPAHEPWTRAASSSARNTNWKP